MVHDGGVPALIRVTPSPSLPPEVAVGANGGGADGRPPNAQTCGHTDGHLPNVTADRGGAPRPPPPPVGAAADAGRRRSRRRRNDDEEAAALSRRLSRLLRHDLLDAGLTPAPDGFVPLAAVLRCRSFAGVSADAVERVVATSEKQRFSLVSRVANGGGGGRGGAAAGAPGATVPGAAAAAPELMIRANQGFSARVAAALSADAVYARLTPPAAGQPPLLGVHATTSSSFARIAADDGLRAMRRDAIHFSRLPLAPPPAAVGEAAAAAAAATASAAAADGAAGVAPADRTELTVLRGIVAGVRSGRRRGGELVDRVAIVVDVGASAAAGIVWHVSSNGVLLTQGGVGGVLPKRWIVRVTDVVSGADLSADLWPAGGQ
ncbi:hypothetical protein BU14_0159s0044 [Porphyra umbilicalis]|uniref:2'-phosphotransferase n=1 Tax=Porphyra umbilicalis TaxID=2786 RepID=A0A1X6P8H0_PORUM|nr:hypothetical protein BU14_0159s0044 [Porphyra umbilicalis]|eukprot:OSX77189.1 hypothetical protein BU14_0159s0044 [Porphyra umbilicalis]